MMCRRIAPTILHRTGRRVGVARVGARVAAGGMLVIALCGCQTAAEEPAGLSAQRMATPVRTPTASLESDATTSASPVAEPAPTFTQPHLPGEPRVVELPEVLALEPPQDATDEEAAVVHAVARFMASWNAVLFGAGVERSRIEQTATGAQLETLVDYAAKSDQLNRVIVGEPMRLRLLGVEVGSSSADADICLEMIGWVEVTDGVVGPLMPSLERYVVSMVRSGTDWRAIGTQQQPAECG